MLTLLETPLAASAADYASFLESKQIRTVPTGLANLPTLSSRLFPYQRDIVAWALRKGRAAIFADCGLGKTLMQLEWATQVPGRVLILAPLAVATQTVREGEKFGVTVTYSRDGATQDKIVITNYEMLQHFDLTQFAGIVLDESSILKSYTGKIRTEVIERSATVPFRLACTATPAPNDYMELGNHAEFVGALTRTEMLSTFFVHDGGDTSKWRLKGHAVAEFWNWVCSWAVMLRRPSDLGYSDTGFVLPKLDIRHRVVPSPNQQGLLQTEAQTLQERQQARAESIESRAASAAELVLAEPNEQWLIWCNLNAEAEAVRKLLPGVAEVSGSDKAEVKEARMLGFTSGAVKDLVTKPSIAGFGMNWQNCARVLFLGLSDSYEQFYQAVRRSWRFGQTREVHAYVVTSSREGAVVANIQRKEEESAAMAEEMVRYMQVTNTAEVHAPTVRTGDVYGTAEASGDRWKMFKGDCVESMLHIPSNSLHYSIFSPPFASLYTYSASERDMGNCRTHAEFFEHLRFLVRELYRALIPGRLFSFHCMNLPTSKERDGVIGITDFRGDLIRIFREAGFIFHSEVCIWKDPVTAMQRTKALGLLHKQLKKDSCMSRQGIPDYLVTMRKPGDNPERVTHTPEDFPVSLWQNYASPVWMDINPSNTLQRKSARAEKDERHICPLQLEVIERALKLWTNPGDTVFSPFAGIGSEGYVALQQGRAFIGCELKESYYQQAVANLRAVTAEGRVTTLPLLPSVEDMTTITAYLQ